MCVCVGGGAWHTMVCTHGQIEEGNSPVPAGHSQLFSPPYTHVSKRAAFPKTWHMAQGGVTGSDRIDSLPLNTILSQLAECVALLQWVFSTV